MADSKAGLNAVEQAASDQKESLMNDKPEKAGERSENVSKIDKKADKKAEPSCPKHTSRASGKRRRRPSIVDRVSQNRRLVAVVIGLFLVIIAVVIIMEVTRSGSSPVTAVESDNTTTTIPTTVPHRS